MVERISTGVTLINRHKVHGTVNIKQTVASGKYCLTILHIRKLLQCLSIKIS